MVSIISKYFSVYVVFQIKEFDIKLIYAHAQNVGVMSPKFQVD